MSSQEVQWSRPSKPGPKPNICIWCSEALCSHCQCPGYGRCDHKSGEPCTRSRYKRRLVCNSCEKVKLKEESVKRGSTKSGREKLLFQKKKKDAKIIRQSLSSDILTPLKEVKRSPFETLLYVVSNEAKKNYSSYSFASAPQLCTNVSLRDRVSSDDVGYSVDSESPVLPSVNGSINVRSSNMIVDSQCIHSARCTIPSISVNKTSYVSGNNCNFGYSYGPFYPSVCGCGPSVQVIDQSYMCQSNLISHGSVAFR